MTLLWTSRRAFRSFSSLARAKGLGCQHEHLDFHERTQPQLPHPCPMMAVSGPMSVPSASRTRSRFMAAFSTSPGLMPENLSTRHRRQQPIFDGQTRTVIHLVL